MVNKNKLHKIINVSSKIAGVRLESMTSMYETRVKGRVITRDRTHPLYSQYHLLPSGRRYNVPRLQARASRSFVPISIGLLNKVPISVLCIECGALGAVTGRIFLGIVCLALLCIVYVLCILMAAWHKTNFHKDK